jgi:hypothetical protein
MFLSDPQISLLESAVQQPVDILGCNVRTVAALSARGLLVVMYATKSGTITKVAITTAGLALAPVLRKLPSYQDCMKSIVPAKKQELRHAQAA